MQPNNPRYVALTAYQTLNTLVTHQKKKSEGSPANQPAATPEEKAAADKQRAEADKRQAVFKHQDGHQMFGHASSLMHSFAYLHA